MNSKPLTPREIAFGDVERELKITRKVLEAMPPAHYQWKPHAKSMSLEQLALHVAFLPDWMRASLAGNELNAADAPRPPKHLKDQQELLELFDRNAAQLQEAIVKFDMAQYNDDWSMRNGDQIMVTRARPVVYRIWSINHLIHHRGQLCLYLRLLDVPVPTVYFNTADDPTWVFE